MKRETSGRMGQCFLVGLALTFTSATALAQSEVKTTPGTELVAERVERTESFGLTVFVYVLRATGYLAGARLGLIVEPVIKPAPDTEGRTMVAQYRTPLSVDAKGNVLDVKGQPYRVGLRGPSPGETYYVSIMSIGKKRLQSTIRITPVPLEASEGSCHLDAILTAPAGARYEVHATGFQPGEPVSVRFDPEGKTISVEAHKDGSWVLKVEPKMGDTPEGSLQLNATAQSCQLSLALPWKNSKAKRSP